jgi:hypothetical protein
MASRMFEFFSLVLITSRDDETRNDVTFLAPKSYLADFSHFCCATSFNQHQHTHYYYYYSGKDDGTCRGWCVGLTHRRRPARSR